MPYIEQARRNKLEPFGHNRPDAPRSPGELNYVITYMVDGYLGACPDYAAFNSVIGVLECAKQELYRRLVAPYEDEKCKENGDVYAK